jgi:hypothetical protein
MAIKINFPGFEIAVSTAAEAAAVVRELSGLTSPPQRGRPKSTEPKPQKKGFDVDMATLDFLNAIRAAGDDGATSEAIQKALKANEPKGIGSKAGRVNKVIKKLGYGVDSVYTSVREPGEGRFWSAAPKMDEAYEAIRRKISERR